MGMRGTCEVGGYRYGVSGVGRGRESTLNTEPPRQRGGENQVNERAAAQRCDSYATPQPNVNPRVGSVW